jgi:hypothetical protein
VDGAFVKAVLVGALVSLAAAGLQPADQGFKEDFETAWQEVASTYAYFDVKATRWSDIPLLYRSDLAKVRSNACTT